MLIIKNSLNFELFSLYQLKGDHTEPRKIGDYALLGKPNTEHDYAILDINYAHAITKALDENANIFCNHVVVDGEQRNIAYFLGAEKYEFYKRRYVQ